MNRIEVQAMLHYSNELLYGLIEHEADKYDVKGELKDDNN